MLSITRRGALMGGAGLVASCAHAAPAAPAREGRVAVPGGNVVWRRFGGGPKPPLLLIHGGPGMTSNYLDPFAALGDERSVYTWDQLGCGRSDRPTDPSLWRIERFVEEMHVVRTALGLEEAHLLGSSWGTILIVDYLLTKGEAGVKSAVLAGPVMSASRYVADTRRMITALPPEHQAAIAAAEASGDYSAPGYQAATTEFYARHFIRHATPETEVFWQRSLEGLGQESYLAMNGPSEFSLFGSLRTYEREADLHRLNTPILYMSGEFDTCTPEASRQYAARTPNAQVAVIPDAGHASMIDAPVEANNVVRAFIRAHEA